LDIKRRRGKRIIKGANLKILSFSSEAVKL